MIDVSIVSHGHGKMISRLVEQLLTFPEIKKIIITLNISEQINIKNNDNVVVISNKVPRGFAQNHNAAFQIAENRFFCVLNPDIQFKENPYPRLLLGLGDKQVGVVAPRVLNSFGEQEDSWRYFPTLASLIKKFVNGDQGRFPEPDNNGYCSPDWVAGMFMLFREDVFRELSGFDEKFFLYYEDVDICARLWNMGKRVDVCPKVEVIHDARRDSRHKLKYLFWHLNSFVRYFIKFYGKPPRVRTR